ncbi:hypothetical protein HC928_02775 [bacterium]|nr:hypothetical protein [bacterium]
MSKSKIAASVTPTHVEESVSLGIDAKSRLQALVKEEGKMVKGRFRCYETPGSEQTIIVRKYKELPMFKMKMVDGEVYEIPLYVARHLNGIDVVAQNLNGNIGSCSYPIHGFKWNPSQPMPASAMGAGSTTGQPGIPVPIIGVSKRVRRFGFESLEFAA